MKPIDIPAGATSERRILSYRDILRRENCSRTTIWKKIKAGKFPAPVDRGNGRVGFLSDEYEAYQASLPRVSYAPKAA